MGARLCPAPRGGGDDGDAGAASRTSPLSPPDSPTGPPVRVCAIEDFPAGSGRVARIPAEAAGGPREVAVWHLKGGGSFHALDNACYHHGSPLLPKGSLTRFCGRLCVSCPWHGYKIAVEDGEGLYLGLAADMRTEVRKSKGRKQRAHRVIVADGDVFVRPSLSGEFESDAYYPDAEYGDDGEGQRGGRGAAPGAPQAEARLSARRACCASGRTSLLVFSAPGARLLAGAPAAGQHAVFTIDLPTSTNGARGVATRAWTLVAAARGEVCVAVRRKGGGTASEWAAAGMPVGARVLLCPAAAGAFVLPQEPGPVLLAGGGVGLTPLVAMLRGCFGDFARPPRTGGAPHSAPHPLLLPGAAPPPSPPPARPGKWDFVLLYSEREAADLLFTDELAALEASATEQGGSLRVIVSLTGPCAGWGGRTGRFTAGAAAAACGGAAALRRRRCYLCGPGAFVDDFRRGLADAGVPADCILSEDFSAPVTAR